MTVVVGYLAGKSGSAPLHLAVAAARTLETTLTVATIVPKPWTFPSPARVDAEFAVWADQLAADSAREAQRELHAISSATGETLEVHYHSHAHKSVSGGMVDVVNEVGAQLLVLGSSANGQLGQVVVGSTADRLLHSSPVPVAISSPGYQSRTGRLTRLTCAYSAVPQSVDVVSRCAEYAERMQIPLRIMTFAVRGRTMYPPDVGLDAEDSILEAWAAQARDTLGALKIDGVIGNDVALQVITGHSWLEALHRADWVDGEILTLGTSPSGDLRRVFLGVRSGKIIRHSPVPVLVLPG
jgi:nucleotide-binding universal stress UspA family protein